MQLAGINIILESTALALPFSTLKTQPGGSFAFKNMKAHKHFWQTKQTQLNQKFSSFPP